MFQRFLVNFSVSSNSSLSGRVSALKFPLAETEYCAYNNIPRVEHIKLLTIIEAKIRQKGRCATCIRLSAQIKLRVI